MTRTVLLLVILGCLVFIVAGISKYLDGRTIDVLKVQGDSLRLYIAVTDVRLEAYSADSARFAAFQDSTQRLRSRLRADLHRVRVGGRVTRASLDSARLTVQIDTLAPVLRGMILLEREVAQGFRQERDIERELREQVRVQLTRTIARLREAEVLLSTVIAQRDSAMSIIAGHEARLEFNFFRSLFQDLPRKAACAGGGAIVAELNNGKAFAGAAIALGVCLAVETIF